VAVEVACSGGAHGSAEVGVAGGDLGVVMVDAGVEHGGDEGVWPSMWGWNFLLAVPVCQSKYTEVPMDTDAGLRAELAATDTLPWVPAALVRYHPAECTFRVPTREPHGARTERWLRNTFATIVSLLMAPAEELFSPHERDDVAADVLRTPFSWAPRELRVPWLAFGPGEIAVIGAANAVIRSEVATAAQVLWHSRPGFVTRIRAHRWLLRDVMWLSFWDGSSVRLPVRHGVARELGPVIRDWPAFR
jgi:hypothetical protein